MNLNAELGSVSSSVDLLVERITEMVSSMNPDDVHPAFNEVERNLVTASRRLHRLLRELGA